MFALALLFLMLVIMAISFNVSTVVLSAASISGALLVAFFVFMIGSKIVSRFREQVA